MPDTINTVSFDGNSKADKPVMDRINEWVALQSTTINPTALLRDLLIETLDEKIKALLAPRPNPWVIMWKIREVGKTVKQKIRKIQKQRKLRHNG